MARTTSAIIKKYLKVLAVSFRGKNIPEMAGTAWKLSLSSTSLLLKLKKPLTGPTYIQIEPTTACNFRCVMCANTDYVRKGKMMKLSQLKRIIDEMPSTLAVDLTGIGEPMLNRELVDFIKYLKGKKIYASFTTNGSLVDRKAARKIIGSGLDRIVFSIDAGTKKEFEKIRKGGNFDVVIANLKNFASLKKKRGSKIDIVVRQVAMSENIKGVPDFVRLMGSLGVRNIIITTLYETEECRHLRIDEGERKKIEKEAGKIAGGLGIDLEFRSLEKKPISKCFRPYMHAYVSVDGLVAPCCLVGSYKELIEKHNFGNIFKKGFREIWESREYEKFRENVTKGRVPPECRSCPEFS